MEDWAGAGGSETTLRLPDSIGPQPSSVKPTAPAVAFAASRSLQRPPLPLPATVDAAVPGALEMLGDAQRSSLHANCANNRFAKELRFGDAELAMTRIGVGPAGEGTRATVAIGKQLLSANATAPRPRMSTAARPRTERIVAGHGAALAPRVGGIGPGPDSVPKSSYRPATAAAGKGKGKGKGKGEGSAAAAAAAGGGGGGGAAAAAAKRRPRTSGSVRGGYSTWSGCKATAPSPTLGARQKFGDFTATLGGAAANPGPGAYSVPSLFGGRMASSRNRTGAMYSAGGGKDVRPCNRARVRRADALRTRGGEVYVYDEGYHDARIADTRCLYDMPPLLGNGGRTAESNRPGRPAHTMRGRQKFGTMVGGMEVDPGAENGARRAGEEREAWQARMAKKKAGPCGARAAGTRGMDARAMERVARRQKNAEDKASQRTYGAFMDKLLVPRGCSTANSAAAGFERGFFHDGHSQDVFLFNQPRRFEGCG